jgi:hypothetical protein
MDVGVQNVLYVTLILDFVVTISYTRGRQIYSLYKTVLSSFCCNWEGAEADCFNIFFSVFFISPSSCTRVRTSKLISGFNGPQEMVVRSAGCRALSYTVSRTLIVELKPYWLESGADCARLWYPASGRPVCVWRSLEYACLSNALFCLWGYFCLGIIIKEDEMGAFCGTQGWHEKQNISRKTWSKAACWKT